MKFRPLFFAFATLLFFIGPVSAVDMDVPTKTPSNQTGNKVLINRQRIFVNDELFFIKGIAYQPTYQEKTDFKDIPFSVFENDFKMMKEAGINTVRTYHPLPPELLDLAEKNGLMVIQSLVDISHKTSFNLPKELERVKKEALAIVERDKNRPCILMWSLYNDMPFNWQGDQTSVVATYGFDKVNTFIKEVYSAVKEADPSRPVTASNILNGLGHPIGFDFLDVVGVNLYVGIYHWFDGDYDQDLALRIVKRLERFSKDYNKPVILSETGYCGFWKGSSQEKVLEAQIKTIGQRLAGIVIFEWQDEWQKAGNPNVHDAHMEEHWGILSAERKPKPTLQVLSALFNSIPTSSFGYLGKYEWVPNDSGSASDGKEATPLDGFEYATDKDAQDDFKKNWHSKTSNFFMQTELNDKYAGDSSLKIIFAPNNFGSWMHAQKIFQEPRDMSSYTYIQFYAKRSGTPVSFSLLLIDKDKERWKTRAVIPSDQWKSYRFDLSNLIRDPNDFLRDGVVEGNNKIDLKTIQGFALEVNEVPYFEDFEEPSVILIDQFELIK